MLIDCGAGALRHCVYVRQLHRQATAAAAAAHVANAQLHTSALRVARSPILAPNGISAPSAFCDRFSSRHERGGYYMITHLPY